MTYALFEPPVAFSANLSQEPTTRKEAPRTAQCRLYEQSKVHHV